MNNVVKAVRRSALGLFIIGAFFVTSPVYADACTPIVSVPTTITVPGVYCLSSDLVFSTFGVAIDVQVDDVTLDFKGHELKGSFTQNMTGVAAGTAAHTIIRNGKITNARTGVIVGRNGLVEGMFVKDVIAGVHVGGEYSAVRNNIITDVVPRYAASSAGILLTAGCGTIVENNTIQNFRQFQGPGSSSNYGNGIRNISRCSALIKNNYIHGKAVAGAGETAGIDDAQSGSLIIGNVFDGFVTKNVKCGSMTRYKDNISTSVYGVGFYNCSASGDLGGNF